jgi:hypothetical protein
MSDNSENAIEEIFVEDLYSNLYFGEFNSKMYLIYENLNSNEIVYRFVLEKTKSELEELFNNETVEKNIKIKCDENAEEHYIMNMSFYHINENEGKMKLYYKTEEDKQSYLVNKYYNVDDLNEVFTNMYDSYALLCKMKKNKKLFVIKIVENTIKINDIANKKTRILKKVGNLDITSDVVLSDIYIEILNNILDKNYNLNIIIEEEGMDRIVNGYGYVPVLREDYKEIDIYEENEVVKVYENLHENEITVPKKKEGEPDEEVILYDRKQVEKIYEKLEKYCELKRQTHWMCSRHYSSMDRFFTVPAIVLSSLSGIGSFLASTDTLKPHADVLTISVGVMASVTTLFQSFSNAFEYSTKSEAHQNATEAFDQIITKLRFERLNPKANVNAVEFIDSIENLIVETKQRCKYIVPDWIELEYSDKKFSSLKDNVTKDIYKKMISLKSEKYLEAMNNKELEDLDLSKIDKELGFKGLNEKDCCGN